MRFSELGLDGAVLVVPEPREDARGSFARTFCATEFAGRGLVSHFPQSNVSRNRLRGTLRGMHYNAAPHQEAKLVRCTRGRLYDVIVDLRRSSPTRRRFVGVELDATSGAAVYVPAGFAHGVLSLQDDTEALYMMGSSHVPEAARGFRWDDPAFGIEWPLAPVVLSERDRGWPDWDDERFDG